MYLSHSIFFQNAPITKLSAICRFTIAQRVWEAPYTYLVTCKVPINTLRRLVRTLYIMIDLLKYLIFSIMYLSHSIFFQNAPITKLSAICRFTFAQRVWEAPYTHLVTCKVPKNTLRRLVGTPYITNWFAQIPVFSIMYLSLSIFFQNAPITKLSAICRLTFAQRVWEAHYIHLVTCKVPINTRRRSVGTQYPTH